MTKNTAMPDPKEFTQQVIQRALSGQHTKPEFLGSFQELQVARILRTATKKIATGFKNAAKTSYQSYLRQLKSGIDNFQLLLDHRTFNICANFYKTEVDAVDDTIDEYINYAFFSGHFFNHVFLGLPRPDEDKYDSRKPSDKNINLF